MAADLTVKDGEITIADGVDEIAFGTIPEGGASRKVFTLLNSGDATLTLDAATVPNGFTIAADSEWNGSDNTELEASESIELIILMVPATAETKSGTLSITSDDSSSPYVLDLAGEVIEALVVSMDQKFRCAIAV